VLKMQRTTSEMVENTTGGSDYKHERLFSACAIAVPWKLRRTQRRFPIVGLPSGS
jgi:hypothetical protein